MNPLSVNRYKCLSTAGVSSSGPMGETHNDSPYSQRNLGRLFFVDDAQRSKKKKEDHSLECSLPGVWSIFRNGEQWRASYHSESAQAAQKDFCNTSVATSCRSGPWVACDCGCCGWQLAHRNTDTIKGA
jgi:hypothetical protein